MASGRLISISIVSHAQADLVSKILSDLSGFADPANFEIILTKNVPERLAFGPEDFPYSVRAIENVIPKGFGANHNAAFQIANGEWFCVMKPILVRTNRRSAIPQSNLLDYTGFYVGHSSR